MDVSDLGQQMDHYGNAAFVLTSGGDERPHVVQLSLVLRDGKLVTTVGRGCARNVAERPELSLLWPATQVGEMSLIVDGVGELSQDGEDTTLTITPTSAVKHRPAP